MPPQLWLKRVGKEPTENKRELQESRGQKARHSRFVAALQHGADFGGRCALSRHSTVIRFGYRYARGI